MTQDKFFDQCLQPYIKLLVETHDLCSAIFFQSTEKELNIYKSLKA